MVKEKSFFEELNHGKPESFEEEVFVATKSKKPIYIGLTLFLCLVLLLAFTIFNRVEVPDMTSWQLSEVGSWAKKNKITLIGKQLYDKDIDLDGVIEQSKEAGTKVRKNSSVEVTFSKGPNPDEPLDFPNVKSMNLEEIQRWIKDNKLSGINISYEHSASMDKGTVISLEFIDGDKSSFVRKNRVKVVVSKGVEALTDTLTMPDLYGKTKREVLKWALDNKIELDIKEDYSDYVEKDSVISQDIPKDNKINRTDKVTLVISKGQAIPVPDFMNLTSSEASELAKLYDLRLFIKSVPSSGQEDRILYQDVNPNDLAGKDDIITLHVSKRSLTNPIPDLVGMTKSQASEIMSVHKIKVVFKLAYSTEKEDLVISQSHAPGSVVHENDVVTVLVSSGQIQIPDFKGMSKLKAEALAEDLGLRVLFNPVVNVHQNKDIILKQDYKSGDIVDKDTRITLDVSVNKGTKVIDLTNMTKEEAEFWAESKGYKLRVIDVYSSSVERNKLFNQNYKNIYLPENEAIVVYHSLGKVQVGNHIGDTKESVEDWVKSVNEKGANITVDFKASKSTTYAKGQITNHTPKNQEIDLDGKLIFYVCTSKIDKTSETSTFESMSESDFVKWCHDNDITYKIIEVYMSSVKEGYIFGEGLKKTVTDGEILIVKKSLGPVPVENFIGKSKADFERWLSEVNDKEAGIKVSYVAQAGGVKDTIAMQSVTSGHIDTGSSITITVYTGL
ncbi:PASTA domain-containing protein [Acidaminobacter sp. JC074]|uniref:PASTA domain-containing protein n=1 Tax=Acidaminobacter sp. JC074 TaxID=2530199 RepID=UPI001F0EF5E7|nr:PASTA domain-containing protein [Acidaminobacter sp. JC074]MCH4887901.1 PASTA domain-containing protein [Acidaminobacter sp. JC074]